MQTTTDILATELTLKCTVPPDRDNATPYQDVQCCTSDLTLAEFRTLRAMRDGANSAATTLDQYLAGTPGWTTDEDVGYGTLLAHAKSIELLHGFGVSMAPELKVASDEMPYEGDYTQANYAQQMIDECTATGISPDRVFAQSFQLEDVLYWISEHQYLANRPCILMTAMPWKASIQPMLPPLFRVCRSWLSRG